MLMAAAATPTHMVGSTHSSSSSSSISPPPSCHPVVLAPNHHHHHQILYDLDLGGTPSPSPPTPAAAATASPPRPRHNHLRPRRASGGKPRRPRPSRKLPTTYISADAASFRRMVHQVTAADDVPLPLPGPVAAPAPELLCRGPAPAAPFRGALTTTTTTLTLPTLDTSAFLLGADARRPGGEGSGRAPPPGASSCHGSASSVAVVVDPGAALQTEASAGGGDVCGFRSLGSWHEVEDDALF